VEAGHLNPGARLLASPGGALAWRWARAALAAVDPEPLVRAALAGERRRIAGALAIGKAAAALARGAQPFLAGAPGLALRPRSALPVQLSGWQEEIGGHPLPDAGSFAAGAAVRAWLARFGAADLVLVLVSGGGSACVEAPAPGLSAADLVEANRRLVDSGLSIGAVNAVRKHLSSVKGGGLLRASAAQLLTLVLSDVPGDDLATVASGPFSPDPTTYAEALAAAREAALSLRLLSHLRAGAAGERPETLKSGDPALARLTARLLAGVSSTAVAALRAAREEGIAGLRRELRGDAAAAGKELVEAGRARAGAPALVVASGETTIRLVARSGRGGRNQELALAAARELAGSRGELVLALATDGVDGPTEAAGALVDGTTWQRIEAAGIDPGTALSRHDALPALDAAGDLLATGPTGTNVADLALYLREQPEEHGG